jgi:hypothetical protein
MPEPTWEFHLRLGRTAPWLSASEKAVRLPPLQERTAILRRREIHLSETGRPTHVSSVVKRSRLAPSLAFVSGEMTACGLHAQSAVTIRLTQPAVESCALMQQEQLSENNACI